jgi:hypothetical protein
MAEQPRFVLGPNCVENLIRFSFNGISFLPPNPIFAFSLPFHTLLRYPPGMPAPERNHVQVVRCKGVGCGRNVPTPVEVRVRTGSITVLCPVCLERRSYIVSTEVFMGSPSWEVALALQGRR